MMMMMMKGWRASTVGSVVFLAVLTLCHAPQLAAQAPLEGPAGLSVQDEPIEAALRLLQRTAGVSLVYSPDLLPAELRVSCRCETVTVGQALGRILRGTGLTYDASRTQIRIRPEPEGAGAHVPGTVLGRVEERSGGQPVVNAMIRLDNGQGVLSDATGFFVIRNVPPGTYRMEVTSIGWRPGGLTQVVVVPADTTRVVVRIDREAIPLPDMLVSPGTFSMLEDVSPGTVRALTREEIETTPQVGEDIFRAVKRLPGVSSDDISTKLHVRGGYDREVLVRLDGLELYEPYHLKDWDGALGIVDLNAVGGLQLTSGGFGVEYGDKMTGVLDMTSRSWVGDSRTTLGFSVSNITGMSRGSFAEGNGSWLFSARRGFMDWVMALIGESEKLRPRYYDVFGKVSRQFGHHLLSVHMLHAGDEFVLVDRPDEGIDEVDFNSEWSSSYAWANWDASLGRVSAETSLYVGRVRRERNGLVEDLNNDPNLITARDHRVFTFGGLRHDLGLELSEGALLKVGGEVKRLRADYDYANVTRHTVRLPNDDITQGFDSTQVDLEPRGHELSAYVAARLRPIESLTAEMGLRYDGVSHTDDRDVAPRFLAALALSDRTTLRASWGRYHQSHGIHELQVGDGETDFEPSERADQAAVGLEHGFPGGVRLRVELYDRRMPDPRPVFFNLEQELQIFPEATEDRVKFEADRARAHGVEVFLDRRTGTRWAWSASYVLARAEDELDGRWIPRRFDQRHTVSLNATYRPNRRWNLTAGWRYHTGWPATSWTWDVTTLSTGWNWWDRRFGELRGERLPAYHRLDLRVTRDFVVAGNAFHAFVDLFNVYDRTNLGSFDYTGNYVDNQLLVSQVNGQEMLPLLPTFGFRYEF